MRPFLFLVASMALTACRDHTLSDGEYVLSTKAVLRDDCGLAVKGEAARGTLRTTGHVVYFTLEQPALRLSGDYRSGTETFYADGSLTNFSTQIGSASCLLDTVDYHLDGQDLDPTHFEGELSLSTTTRQNDRCVCKLWFTFDGVKQ